MAVAQVIPAYFDRDKSVTARRCFCNNYQNSFLQSTEQGKYSLCAVIGTALRVNFLHIKLHNMFCHLQAI